MAATEVIKILARVGGKTVEIPLWDLVCVKIETADGGCVRIMPGTVGRALRLGSDALVAEMQAEPALQSG